MAPEGFAWSVIQKCGNLNAPTLAFEIGKAGRALFTDNALHDALPLTRELILAVTTVHLAETIPKSLGFPWSEFSRALKHGFLPGQRLKLVRQDSKHSQLLATAAFASSYLVGKESCSRISEEIFKEVLSSQQGSRQKIIEDQANDSVENTTMVRMLSFNVSDDSAFISQAGSTSKSLVVQNLAAVLHSGAVDERNTLHGLIMRFLRTAYGVSTFGFPEPFDKVPKSLRDRVARTVVKRMVSQYLERLRRVLHALHTHRIDPKVALRAHHMQALVRRFKFSLHKAKESQVELSLGDLQLALTYAISMERDIVEIESIRQIYFSRNMVVVQSSSITSSTLPILAVLGALSSIVLGYFAAKLVATSPWNSPRRGRKIAPE